MQTALETMFNNMEPSDFIKAHIRDKVAHHEYLYEHIASQESKITLATAIEWTDPDQPNATAGAGSKFSFAPSTLQQPLKTSEN